MDMGQGLFVAIGQMVAEELDVPFKAVTVIMGDTATSVNQGGASGSTGIQMGGKQMRMAAAEARRVLVEMAAAKLGLPADAAHRHRRRGACQGRCEQEGVLRRADRRALFQRPARLEQADAATRSTRRARRKPKDAKDYKIVGKPIAREDIAPKVYAQEDFCTDVKVPGMVHGRMIRPAIAGAVPVKVDESSIKDIPGAKVVWEKGFLGVVADKEWDAIKAAQKLKVEWSDVKPPFPDQAALYDHIRKAPVRKREVDGKENGNVDEAFKTAARVVEAEYEWPFQSHACMGPACALVEIKDGNVTCWTGSQKPHFVQRRRRRDARRSGGEGPRQSGCSAPAPMAATTPTMRRWMPPCWRRRSASRCACSTRATRAPAGIRKDRPRSTAPARRSTPPARSSPTSSSARGSRASTSRPTAASRRTRSPGNSSAWR